MKKLLSIIMCLAMLSSFASVLPVNVGADPAEYPEIKAGETVTVTIEEDPLIAYLKFVPEEDGAYTVYSLADADSYGYIYDEDMNELMCDDDSGGNGNFRMTFMMSAGTVYYIGARYYSYGTGSFDVAVEKSPSVEYALINESEQTVYVGGQQSNYVYPSPEDAYVYDCEWTSSDENIATVYGSGRDVYATGVSAGDVTITATLNGTASASYTLHVIDRPAVSSVQLSTTEMSGYAGDQGYVYIEVEPEEAAINDVVWTSSDESVFSANSEYYNGETYTYLSYNSAGEGTLTVSVNGELSATCHVTVSERPKLTGASLSSTEMSGYVGFSKSITVSCVPEDALWDEIEWTTSDASVAEVNSYYYQNEAYIEFVGTGTAEITATINGEFSATCAVTVTEQPYASTIEFENSELEGYIGETGYNYANIGPEDCIVNEIVWTSSDNDVAHIETEWYNGERYVYIDYLAGGTATVTVTVNGEISESFNVTVNEWPSVSEIALDYSSLSGYVGEDLSNYVYTYPDDAQVNEIVWSSSDDDVAYVDSSAYHNDHYVQVSLVSAGEATLTVTVNGEISATCPVTVSERPAVSDIGLNNSYMRGYVGEELYNSVYIYPDDAIANDIVWTSSDEGVFSANSENYNGSTYVYITCNSPGTATLTVTVNGEFSATCPVAVEERPELESIEFYRPVHKGFVGQNWIEEFYTLPDGALAGDIVYSSSDESVVTVEKYEYNTNSVEISLVSEGTAEVTVTAANGASATISVVSRVPGTLYEDVPAAVSIDEYNSAERYYFTPETDGEYVFGISNKTDGNNIVGMSLIEDSYHDLLDWSENGRLSHSLSAGTKYYIELYSSSYQETPEVDFDLTVSKAAAATSLTVTPSEIEGYIDTGYYLKASFEPWNSASESVMWTSADDGIATVDSNGYVLLVSEGVTTITATGENGLSATCTVRVKDYDPIALDETMPAVISEQGGSAYFRFTPEEDGYYVFTSMSASDTCGYIYYDLNHEPAYDDDSGEGNNFLVGYRMTAGKSYVFQANFNEASRVGSFNVTVYKAPAATSIYLSEEQLNGYVDTRTYYDIYAYYIPGNAAHEEITWTSSDNGVAAIRGYGDSYVEITLISAGSAVITATTESGLSASCTVTAVERPEAESISFGKTSMKSYVGLSSHLYVYYDPSEAARQSITWSSSDSGVARIAYEYEQQAELRFVSAGNAVITATTEKGLTASCSITVVEPGILYEDTPETVQIRNNTEEAYYFTPSVSGEYVFDCRNYSNSNRAGVNIFSGNNSYIGGGDKEVCVRLTEGVRYLVTTSYRSWSGSGNGTYELIVSRAVPATSVAISPKDAFNKYVGTQQYVYIEAEPWNANINNITWSTSDPSVVSVSNEGTGAWVYMGSVGTASVTATLPDGLSASCTFNVRDYDTISVGETKEVTIEEGGEYGCFRFTPDHDGCYAFYSISTDDTYGTVYDRYLNTLANDDSGGEGSNFRVKYFMNAGETYVLGAGYWSDYRTGSFDVSLEEAPFITDLQILTLPDKLEYVNSNPRDYIDYTGLSLRATWSDGTNTEWTYGTKEYIVDERISFDKSSVEATRTVYITCGGKTVSYQISLIDDPVASIELVTASAKQYIENYDGYHFNWYNEETEEVEDKFWYYTSFPDDAVIKINYTNGTSKTANVGESVDGYYVSWNSNQDNTPWSLGSDNTSYVTYLGHTAYMPVTVVSSPIASLELVTASSAVYYEETNGNTFEWYNKETGKYEEKFYYFTKDHSDAVIRINYTNGTSKTAKVGDYVDGYHVNWDSNQNNKPWTLGSNNTSVISYLDKTVNMPVTVVKNPVKSIELVSGLTTPVYENASGFWEQRWAGSAYEDFFYYTPNYSEAVIKINYENGTSKTGNVGTNIDGFGINVDGNQYETPWTLGSGNSATISYAGKEVALPVTVVANPADSIVLDSAPTRVYIYGDADYGWPQPTGYYLTSLDYTGFAFTVHYKNGTEKHFTSADINNYMIDGQRWSVSYNEYCTGAATIPVTFTYMGKTLEFNVTVVEAEVISIEQLSPPTNPNCDLDNLFVPNWTGYKFRVNYSDGTHKDYEITEDDLVATIGGAYGFVTGFEIDGVRGDFLGEIGGDFTLSFLGKTCPVTGIVNTHGKNIKSVALSNVTSDANGMKVDITYEDNSKEQIVLNKFIPSTGTWGSGGGNAKVALTEKGILLFMISEDSNNYVVDILDEHVTVPKKVILPGDANGDKRVDMRDVLLMRKHMLNIEKVKDENFENADMNGNRQIDARDLLAVRKKILNIH